MTSSPPLRVLTDADLLKRITSFAMGIPWPLYEFWLQHRYRADTRVVAMFLASTPVVATLVEHGTLAMLDLAKCVRLPNTTCIFSGPPPPHTLDLHVVVPLAIKARRPDALEWGILYELEHRDSRQIRFEMRQVPIWQSALHECRDDDMGLLDVLKRHLPAAVGGLQKIFTPDFLARNVETAAQLRWIVAELPELQLEPAMLTRAAEKGNLEMVTYLCQLGGCDRCDESTSAILYYNRIWDVFAFLVERDLVTLRSDVVRAMVEGKDDFVRQLVEKCSIRFQDAFEAEFHDAVEVGNAKRVRLLLDKTWFNTDFLVSIDNAANSGLLEVIQLFHERGNATATTEAMDGAAENGHWEIVKFLHENRSEGCTTRTMDAAVEQERLELVRFLSENRTEGCSPNAMTVAAKYGNMEILRFLHEYTNAPCPTEAMDAAAAKGRLNVIRFLHEHRTEGCTVAAMDKAAANGQLHVVRFLHEHRTEGCSVAAMKGALRARQPKLIKFLREHYPQFLGPELLHDALLYGDFGLFLDLRYEFPQQADAVVGDVAFEAGEQLELQTIHFIINVLERTDVAYRAMDGAAHKSRCGQDQWLRAVFAITGAQSCRLSAVRAILGNQTRSFSQWTDATEIAFLASVCCEYGAREMAFEVARAHQNTAMIPALVEATSSSAQMRPLHPFLLDPRTPTWAVYSALDCHPYWHDPYCRYRGNFTWAIRAVYAEDIAMLEVLRGIPVSARPRQNCHGGELDADEIEHQFSFHDARPAAARVGNLPILKWLLKHVDLPVEPTLLTEAVYYHRYEVALWLVEHCPDACKETNWGSMVHVPWVTSCGFDDGLLEWLEAHDAVRAALDFGPIIDAAASLSDSAPLNWLRARYPDLVMARAKMQGGENDIE